MPEGAVAVIVFSIVVTLVFWLVEFLYKTAKHLACNLYFDVAHEYVLTENKPIRRIVHDILRIMLFLLTLPPIIYLVYVVVKALIMWLITFL